MSTESETKPEEQQPVPEKTVESLEETKTNEGKQEEGSDDKKTTKSIKEKGDKSYYYWHDKVSNTVPITPPPLLKVEQSPTIEKPPKKITSYSWYDDEKTVKILIEYEKIGVNKEVLQVKEEQLNFEFSDKGLDMKLANYKNENHQLKMNFSHEIDVAASKVLIRANKLLISLAKKDPETTWYSLQ